MKSKSMAAAFEDAKTKANDFTSFAGLKFGHIVEIEEITVP